MMSISFLGRTLAATWMVFALLASPAAAEESWAQGMFSSRSHDFGTVARGAKADHHFVIENIYEEEVRILGVESSCGCTTPQISKRQLKTWEKAELVATIETRNHTGRKDATVTVTCGFAGKDGVTAVEEVQIQIHVFIRGDIVVQPGEIQFGSVSQGAGAKQTATITYAPGRSDWQIVKLECANPHIEAQLKETGRTPTLISYALSVALKADAPPGYLREQLMLVTNDPNPRAAHVPILAEGRIDSLLSVSPSRLSLGVAQPGKAVVRNVVVKGDEPFRIKAIRSSDERFRCEVSGEAKKVHVVPVTFLAKEPSPSGKAVGQIRIETDIPGAGAAEVSVSVQIVSGQPASR